MVLLNLIMRGKVFQYLMLSLVVIISLYVVVGLLREDAREDIKQDIKIETLEKNEVTRRKVKDAVQQNKESNPDRDATVALEQLRQRQLERTRGD